MDKFIIDSFKELEFMEVKNNNKVKGFEPQCMVCNHRLVKEIESMHEHGMGNVAIIKALKLDDDITPQSLGNHLNKHYPIKKKYYENKSANEDKDNNENNVPDSIDDISYHYLVLRLRLKVNDILTNEDYVLSPKDVKYLNSLLISAHRFEERLIEEERYRQRNRYTDPFIIEHEKKIAEFIKEVRG